MEAWGGLSLTGVASNGNLTQLYPNWVTAGDALPIAAGGKLLSPLGGRLGQLSIKTDGADAGYVELWDLSGLYVPVDVSSATTVTNANLTTLQNKNRAKLMWSQNFAATPASPAPWTLGILNFMWGLAARYVGSGTCTLNLSVEGGFVKKIVGSGFIG